MVTLPERASSPECILVGETRSDIAGIGIIVSFVGQAAISLCLAVWAFFFSKSGAFDGGHAPESIDHAIEQKRLECVSDILMVGNDIQMVIGTSYMISAFSNADSIDTYHLHLVFDIVSFVGVSSAAALVCWTYCDVRLHHSSHARDCASHLFTRHFACFRSSHFTPRHRATYLFAALYLVLTILLCVALDNWALDQPPGRCYFSHLVTAPSAPHPMSDKVYVSFTASWMLLVMLAAALSGARWRHTILVLAFLQFPVHLYMALALRSANQGKLEGGGYENGWDFGQTTAVILLAVAARELFDKGVEFFFFEKDLKKNRALSNRNGKRDHRDGASNNHELSGISSAEEGYSSNSASGAIYGQRLGERSSFAKTASKATNPGDSKMEEGDK
ncbi:uncharacterized protein TrAFT101_003233 [Trichoderma asperellum]|uniref:Uncharacterized protein n=1 Tax=Trichoderma asperellum (strain ATCC 204424 / CBS 433.97 / NBRC 101777) TaxID=1042311 RepID=A0A2T3ZIP9_TRIA4|nr:hypothetical protein M441DRAFT_24810 [Trichoderma asperellum CBS 433.97]PTB44689.1 hypothetical protein M441DRAFT_24810 [Trichoderma asperellum CBS 433.97]UKZ87434.1 hypothetical protein TrAFT101_003233 [Trichoderma asperellum]